MSLTVKVLIGMAAGIVVGLAINLSGANATGSIVNTYVVDGLFHVVGTMFINGLKMLVVPLVFFSLVCGVCGIGNIGMLGRVGGKAFALYMLTTAVAIGLSITIATLFGIGEGMQRDGAGAFAGRESPPLSQVLINIIPSNPVRAMADGDMLPIIVFAILCGISMLMVGRKARSFVEGAEIANEIMMKMVMIVMAVAPYAVFALIGKALAELGFDLLTSLAGYVGVLVGSLFLHLFVTLMIVLKLFSGLSPAIFLRKMRSAQVFAFSTASSNATIPVTMRTVTERLGVSNSVASFTVPFGATINMDGTAIMQGVATVFIANVYMIDLSTGDYLTVIAMSVLASIGTAGVPGVGLIMLSMVFVQVNLPVEGIGLVLGVDRLMDMLRTAVNVSGDAAISTIVAKSENRINVETFRDPLAGQLEDTGSIRIDEAVEADLAEALEEIHQRRD